MECHVANAPDLRRGQVVADGKAAIGRRLPRRLAPDADVRSSIGKNRSLSAGLPASIARSRIMPLLPLVRLSLWPYSVSRLPLMMISACGSNRLTNFSLAGTGSPAITRRWLCLMMRSINDG